MALVARCENRVFFTSGMKCSVYDVQSNFATVIEVPRPNYSFSDEDGSGDRKKKPDSSASDESHIRCIAFSPCHRWLALCDDYKQLTLWQLSDLTLANTWIVLRRASRIIFNHKGDEILVADKAGDIHSYSLKNYKEEARPVLGHVSMLLDVVLTPDEKFIVTCDRDEKIRVSHYPNAYNISGFCLGHREFVTQLAILPHSPNVLVSSSGDGTLRLWNYVNGQQLLVENCPVQDDELETRNGDKEMVMLEGSSNSDKQEIKPAVKCFCIQRVDSNHSVVAVCIHRFQGLLVYSIRGDMTCLQITLIQKLQLPTEPWDVAFLNETIVTAVRCEREVVKAFTTKDFHNINFTPATNLTTFLEHMNSNWQFFKDVWTAPSSVSNLYKRWYDNVKDYMDKKKERLEGPPPKKTKLKP